MLPKYVVITPVRNEEKHLPDLIESMSGQTVVPKEWVVVDDGSNDGTVSILRQASANRPWMKVLSRPDRGFRKSGGGVVEAFNDGYARLNNEDWDYISKLDADLSFSPDYFERCLAAFIADPRLGVAGGMICSKANGQFHCESPEDPVFHVRGATKIYRKSCWQAICPLHPAPGWDTIDEMKANMLGWSTRTLRDIPLWHHRTTGTADGTWKNYVKFGLANYITGYHPIFMLAKCLSRIAKPPFAVGAIGLWWGFCRGYLENVPRVSDRTLIRYVRQQQIRKLLNLQSLWE